MLGGLGAAACVALSEVTEGTTSVLFLAVGFFALVMNLFNLTPIWQLDGQRRLAPVTTWLGLVGLVAAVTYFAPIALLTTGVHLVFPLLPHTP